MQGDNMSLDLTNGKDLIYNGDTVSLSHLGLSEHPQSAHYLSNDLSLQSSSEPGQLIDTLDDSAVGVIKSDSRRYPSAYALWYVALVNEEKRRPLKFGDIVTFRHAGTKKYLTATKQLVGGKNERDTCVILTESKGAPSDVNTHFFLRPVTTSFADQTLITSGSSIQIHSCAEGHYHLVSRPPITPSLRAPEVVSIATCSKTILDPEPGCSDTIETELSSSRNPTSGDLLTCLDAIRLESLVLADLFRQRKNATAQADAELDNLPSMGEIRKRLEDLSKEKQSLLNQLSSIEPTTSSSSVSGNTSPNSGTEGAKGSTKEPWESYKSFHNTAVLASSYTNPAWVMTLCGSSTVPSGVLRGGDMVSMGTLSRPRADMLMRSELATGKYVYTVLAASERDLSKFKELYFRKSQLNTARDTMNVFRRALKNSAGMLPPLLLSSATNSMAGEGVNGINGSLNSTDKASTTIEDAKASEEMSDSPFAKDETAQQNRTPPLLTPSRQQDPQQQHPFSWEHFSIGPSPLPSSTPCIPTSTYDVPQPDQADQPNQADKSASSGNHSSTLSTSSTSSTSSPSSTSSASSLGSSQSPSLNIQCALPNISLEQYTNVVKHFAQIAMSHKQARHFLPYSPFLSLSAASSSKLPKHKYRRPLWYRLSSKHLQQQQQKQQQQKQQQAGSDDGAVKDSDCDYKKHNYVKDDNQDDDDDDDDDDSTDGDIDDDLIDPTNPECLLADIRVALDLLDHNLGDCNRLILYRYANKLIRYYINKSISDEEEPLTPLASSSTSSSSSSTSSGSPFMSDDNADEEFYDNYTVNIMSCLFAQQVLAQISIFMTLSSEVAFLSTCYSIGMKAVDMIKLNEEAPDEEKTRTEAMRRDKILALFGDAESLTKIDGCLSQLRNHLNIAYVSSQHGDRDSSRSLLSSTTSVSDSTSSSSSISPTLIALLPPAISSTSTSLPTSPLLSSSTSPSSSSSSSSSSSTTTTTTTTTSESSSNPIPFTWESAKASLPSSIQKALRRLPKLDLKQIMLSLKAASSPTAFSDSPFPISTSSFSTAPSLSSSSPPISSSTPSSPSRPDSSSISTDLKASEVDDVPQPQDQIPNLSLVLDQSMWLQTINNHPFITSLLSPLNITSITPSSLSSSTHTRRRSIVGINSVSMARPTLDGSSSTSTPDDSKGPASTTSAQPSSYTTCPLLALSSLSFPLAVCSLTIDMDTALTTLEQTFNHRLPWGISQYKLLAEHIQRLNYSYPRPTISCHSSCNALASVLGSRLDNQQSAPTLTGTSSHLTISNKTTQSPSSTGPNIPQSASHSRTSATSPAENPNVDPASVTNKVSPFGASSQVPSSTLQQSPPPSAPPSTCSINHKDCSNCLRMYFNHLSAPPSTLSYLRSVVASPYKAPDHALIPENRPYQPSSMWVIEIVDPTPVDTVTYMAMTDHLVESASTPSVQLKEVKDRSSMINSKGDVGGDSADPLKLSPSSSSKPSKSLKIPLYKPMALNCAPITSSTLVRFKNVLTGDYLGTKLGQDEVPNVPPSASASSPSVSPKALANLPDMGVLVGVPPHLAADLPVTSKGYQLYARDAPLNPSPYSSPTIWDREAAAHDMNRTKDWYQYSQQKLQVPSKSKDKADDDNVEGSRLTSIVKRGRPTTDVEPALGSTKEIEPKTKKLADEDKVKVSKDANEEDEETVDDSTKKRPSSKQSRSSSKDHAGLSQALSYDMYIGDVRDRWLARQSDPSFNEADWHHLMDHDTIIIPKPTFTDAAVLYEYEAPRCLWDVEEWVSKYEHACKSTSLDTPGPLYATVFTIDPCSLSTLGSMKIDFRSRNEVELSEHDYDKEEVRLRTSQRQSKSFYITGSDVGETIGVDDSKWEVKKGDPGQIEGNEGKGMSVTENGKGVTSENESSQKSPETATTMMDKRHILKDQALDMTRITLKLYRPPESNYPATEFDPRVGRDYIDTDSAPIIGAGLSLLVKRLDTRGRNLLHWVQERRGAVISFECMLAIALYRLSVSMAELGSAEPFNVTMSKVKSSPLLSRYSININTNILKSFKRAPKRVTRKSISMLTSLIMDTLPQFEVSGRNFTAACCDLARVCVLDTHASTDRNNSKTHPSLDVSNLRGTPLAHIQELIYDMRIINLLSRILGRIVAARKEITEKLTTAASNLLLSPTTGGTTHLPSPVTPITSPSLTSTSAIEEALSRLSTSSPTVTQDFFNIHTRIGAFFISFFDQRIIPALLSVIKHVAWRSWEMQLVLTQTPRFGTMFRFDLSPIGTPTQALSPTYKKSKHKSTSYLNYITHYAVWDKQTRTRYTIPFSFIANYIEPLNRTRLTEVSSGFGSMVEGSDQGRGRSAAGWCLYTKARTSTIVCEQPLRTNVMGTLPIDTPYRSTLIWLLLQLVVDSVNMNYSGDTNAQSNTTQAAALLSPAPRKRRSSRARDQLGHLVPYYLSRSTSPSSSPLTQPWLASLARTSPITTRQLVLCIRSILRNNLLVLDRFALSTTSLESLSPTSSSPASSSLLPPVDRTTLMERYTYLDGSYTKEETDTNTMGDQTDDSKSQADNRGDVVPRCHLRRSVDPSVISLIFNPELVQLGLPDLTDLFVSFCQANDRGGLASCQPPLLSALLSSVEELQPSAPSFVSLLKEAKSTRTTAAPVTSSTFSDPSLDESSTSSSTSTPTADRTLSRSARLSRLSSLFRLIRYVCYDNEEAVEKLRACPTLDFLELVDLLRSLLHITRHLKEDNASGDTSYGSNSEDVPVSRLTPVNKVEHFTHEEIQTARSLSILIKVLWMTPFAPPSQTHRTTSKEYKEPSTASTIGLHGPSKSSSGNDNDASTMSPTSSSNEQSDDDGSTSSVQLDPVQELRRRIASKEVSSGCHGVVTIEVPLPPCSLPRNDKERGSKGRAKPASETTNESKDIIIQPDNAAVDSSGLVSTSPSSSSLVQPSRVQVTRIHRAQQQDTPKSHSHSRSPSPSPSRSRSLDVGSKISKGFNPDLYTIRDQVVVEAYQFTLDYLQSIASLTLANPLTETVATIKSSSPTSHTHFTSSTLSSTTSSTAHGASSINPRVFHSLLFTSQLKWISILLPFLSVARSSHVYVSTPPGSNANTSVSLWSNTTASLSQAEAIPDDLKLCIGDPLTEIARLIFILLRRAVDSPDHDLAYTVSASASECHARRCEALATACTLLGQMLRAIQVRTIEQQLQEVIRVGSQAKGQHLGTATTKTQHHIARTPTQARTSPFLLTSPPSRDEPGTLEMTELNPTKRNEEVQVSIIPTPEQAYHYIVREENSDTRHLHKPLNGARGLSNELARVLFRLFHYNSTDLHNAVSSLLFQIRGTNLPRVLVLPIPRLPSPSLYLTPAQPSSVAPINHSYVLLLSELSACVSRVAYEVKILQGITADLSPLASALTSLVDCIRQYDGSTTGERAKAALKASYAELRSSFGLGSEDITFYWILQGILVHLGLPGFLWQSLARLTQRLGSSRSFERQFDTTASMTAGLQLLDAIADLYIFICSGNERTTLSLATAAFATVMLETLRHLLTLEQTSKEAVTRTKASECFKKVVMLLSVVMNESLVKEIPSATGPELAASYSEQPEKSEIAMLLCRLMSPTYFIISNSLSSRAVTCILGGLSRILRRSIATYDAQQRSIAGANSSIAGMATSSLQTPASAPPLAQSSLSSSTVKNVIIPLRLPTGTTVKSRRPEDQNTGPGPYGALLGCASIPAPPSRPHQISDTVESKPLELASAIPPTTTSSMQSSVSPASNAPKAGTKCIDSNVFNEAVDIDIEGRCTSLIDQMTEASYALANSGSLTSPLSSTTSLSSSPSRAPSPTPSPPSSSTPSSSTPSPSSRASSSRSSSTRSSSTRSSSSASSSSSGSQTALNREAARAALVGSEKYAMLDLACEEGLLVLHLVASCARSKGSRAELAGQRMLPFLALEKALLEDDISMVAEAVLIHYMYYIHLAVSKGRAAENDPKRHDSVITSANHLIPAFRKRLQSRLPSVISNVTPEFVFLLDVYVLYLGYIKGTVIRHTPLSSQGYPESPHKTLSNETSIACSDIVGIIHSHRMALIKMPLGLNTSPLKLLIQLRLISPQQRWVILKVFHEYFSMSSGGSDHIPLLAHDAQTTIPSSLSTDTPHKPAKMVRFPETTSIMEETKGSDIGPGQGVDIAPVSSLNEGVTQDVESSSSSSSSSPSSPLAQSSSSPSPSTIAATTSSSSDGTCLADVVLTISSSSTSSSPSSSPTNETNQQILNEVKDCKVTGDPSNSRSSPQPSPHLNLITTQAPDSDKPTSLLNTSASSGNTIDSIDALSQCKHAADGLLSILDSEYQFLPLCPSSSGKASKPAGQGLLGMRITLPSFLGSGYSLSNFRGCSLTECGGQDFLIQQLEDLDRYLKGLITSPHASNALLSTPVSDKSSSFEPSVSHKSTSIGSPSVIPSRITRSQLKSLGSTPLSLKFPSLHRPSLTLNSISNSKLISAGTFDVILFERLTTLISESYSTVTSAMESIRLGFVQQFVDLLLQTSIYSTEPASTSSAFSKTPSQPAPPSFLRFRSSAAQPLDESWLDPIQHWLKLGVGRISHEQGDIERLFKVEYVRGAKTRTKDITGASTTTVTDRRNADDNATDSENDEMGEDGGEYEKRIDRQANRHPDFYIPDSCTKDVSTGMKIRRNLAKLNLVQVSLKLIESGLDVSRENVTTQGLRLAVLLLEDSDKEICQAFADELLNSPDCRYVQSFAVVLRRIAKKLERDGSAFTSTLYVPSLTPVVADCAVLTIEIFTRLCHNAFLPGQQVLLRSLPDAGESTSNLLSIIVETISSIQSRLSTYWLSYICNKKATLQPYQAGFYHYYSVACTHLVTSVTAGFLKRSQDLIAKNLNPTSMTALLYALCAYRPLRFSLKEPFKPVPKDDRIDGPFGDVFTNWRCPYVSSTVIKCLDNSIARTQLKVTQATVHMLSMLIEGHDDPVIFTTLLRMVAADIPYYIHLLKYHHYTFNCVNQTWYTRKGVEMAYDHLDTCAQLYGLLSSLAEFSQYGALSEQDTASVRSIRRELREWENSSPDIRRLIASVEVVLPNNHLTRVYFPIPRPFVLGRKRVGWLEKLQEETIADCAQIENGNQRLTEFQRVSLDFSTAVIEDYHSLIRFRSWRGLFGCKGKRSKILNKGLPTKSTSRTHKISKTPNRNGPISHLEGKLGNIGGEGDEEGHVPPSPTEEDLPMSPESKSGREDEEEKGDLGSDDDIKGDDEGMNDNHVPEGEDQETKGDGLETGQHASNVTSSLATPAARDEPSCNDGACCACQGCTGCSSCSETSCFSSNNIQPSKADYTDTPSSCCCGSSTCCSTSSSRSRDRKRRDTASDSVCCCISKEQKRDYYKYQDNRIQSRCITPRQVIRADCWWLLSFIVAILANLCVLAAALKRDDDFGPIPWRYNWVGVASQVLSVINLIANFFVTWNFITPQCMLLAKEWRRSGGTSDNVKAYEILGWRDNPHKVASTNSSKDEDPSTTSNPFHQKEIDSRLHSQEAIRQEQVETSHSTSSSRGGSLSVGSSTHPPSLRSQRRRYDSEQARANRTCATCRSAWRWCRNKMKDKDATIFSGPFSPIIIFRVLCLLSAGLSIYPPLRYLLVVTLFEVVVHNSTITYVLVATTSRLRHIMVTIVLFTFIVYSFTIVAFVYLTDNKVFYNFGEEDMAFSCDTNLFDCFQKHFDNAFRNLPVWYEGTTIPVFSPLYSFLFWFIATIMTAIITGIIIDVFGDMRQAKEDAVKAVSEQCFICQIDRGTFQVNRIPFRHHVQLEHNLWSYIALRHYLNVKLIRRPERMGSVETYLQQAFGQNSVSLYPQDRALSVDRAEKQKEAGSFFEDSEDDWAMD